MEVGGRRGPVRRAIRDFQLARDGGEGGALALARVGFDFDSGSGSGFRLGAPGP
jgi:hypothetical protein